MFKSAATKIAHNTTIPALAGHSDLRPLQDLITAEKTVLTSLQKLRADLVKAGDALRIWGQGEGDDLGDILTASATILTHFATALSTYSSLHHTIRDSMKSVRTREEVLDELRRRRRRVGASAEAAEKKLNKMSPEHKNLGAQTDILNRLREEMRAMDGEIVREEVELGDYKRKCTKDWMGFKFGGLVECCEKGVVRSIPEDVTQPGLPRAYYSSHGRVGDLVVEAQHAVSQVIFSGNPPGHLPTSAPTSRPQAPTSQEPPVQSPFLPTPSLGSNLTLGWYLSMLPSCNTCQGMCIRRASVDELGVHAPSAHYAPQFSSLPTNKERGRDPVPKSSSVGPSMPLSFSTPYDSGVARTEESQSLMASIADALSQSHRGFTLEDATSLGHVAPDEPVPKYELHAGDVGRSPRSEPHGPRLTSSSERDGEEEDGLAYDRDDQSSREGGVSGDGMHHDQDTFSESGGEASVEVITTTNEEQSTTSIQRSVSTGAASKLDGTTSLARAGSQWRIPRVPPPSIRMDEPADERARDAAAAREVSREMDALTFSATAPRSPSGYETPRAPPLGYGAAQSQAVVPYPRHASSENISGHIPAPPPTIVTSIMDGGGAASPTSPKHRSPPPEYPRPTPPFSSPLMASSTSSLNNPGSGGGPRTISAAAFRRQQTRSPNGAVTETGPADTSPLTLRKPSGSPSPSFSTPRQPSMGSGSASPVPEEGAEDQFDYIGAYGGDGAGYAAGRYVSDLERHG
ncbi:hypothetical protein EV363DRAFT_1187353 [Boletus edulis]|nr:hypothetical protein EV363DRAFT_1187353 [Boletus edulis]